MLDVVVPLAQTKTFVESASGELEPRMRDQITASVRGASQEFEAAVARVSDHQLTQLAKSALIVTREAFLQLETRTAEARLAMESAAPAYRSCNVRRLGVNP